MTCASGSESQRENQPGLKQDIADLHVEAFLPQRTTLEKGHGRLEVRRIWASTGLQCHLDFPYAAHVFCLQRETSQLTTGKFRAETVYGAASLPLRGIDSTWRSGL
jgi:hypothetical protein